MLCNAFAVGVLMAAWARGMLRNALAPCVVRMAAVGVGMVMMVA